jgi:hypothetical protein
VVLAKISFSLFLSTDIKKSKTAPEKFRKAIETAFYEKKYLIPRPGFVVQDLMSEGIEGGGVPKPFYTGPK